MNIHKLKVVLMALAATVFLISFGKSVYAEEAVADDLGPETEFIHIGVRNTEYMLSDIDGNEVSTLADGKPKILFFFNTGCKRCKAVERTIREYGLNIDEVDFVMAEASEGGLTQEKAKAFYRDDEIVCGIDCTAKCYGAVETCWNYLRACGFTADETKKPIIVYISEDNIIQGYSWNYTNIYKNARLAGINLEKDAHHWETVQVSDADTGLVESYKSCAACKLEETHTVEVPNPEIREYIYNGKNQQVLSSTSAYTVINGEKTDAGEYEATVQLVNTSDYIWSDGTTESKVFAWSIKKASQKPVVTTKSKSIKAKKLKKKAQSFTLKVTDAKGAKTFKKVNGSTRLKLNQKTGKVTVKKGTKRGTYRLKVKVSCGETTNYEAGASAIKTVVVKVK